MVTQRSSREGWKGICIAPPTRMSRGARARSPMRSIGSTSRSVTASQPWPGTDTGTWKCISASAAPGACCIPSTRVCIPTRCCALTSVFCPSSRPCMRDAPRSSTTSLCAMPMRCPATPVFPGCKATRPGWGRNRPPTRGPALTKTPRRACVTPAAPRATPRRRCTATAQPCCMPLP